MLTFFFVSGLLAFGAAFAVDPWPSRATAPVRLLDIALPGPAEAFFAVVLMMASRPVVQTFANPPDSWGVDVMSDQLAAGNLVWGFGELPTFIAVTIVFFQWIRSEERRAPMLDRRADDELIAYNAQLARMAARRP
jgi:putative copper resistance protein D